MLFPRGKKAKSSKFNTITPFNFFIHFFFLQHLPLAIAEALWDHTSLNSDELAFSSGDVITVLYMEDGTSWWWGTRNIIDEKTAVVNGSNSDDSDGEGKVNNVTDGKEGWFPASYVRVSLLNLFIFSCTF